MQGTCEGKVQIWMSMSGAMTKTVGKRSLLIHDTFSDHLSTSVLSPTPVKVICFTCLMPVPRTTMAVTVKLAPLRSRGQNDPPTRCPRMSTCHLCMLQRGHFST